MKVPSIFKLPQHKRFHFTPRYYDPIKEDIANRTAFIKKQLEAEGAEEKDLQRIESFRYKISGVYGNRQRVEKKPIVIQLFIVILLSLIMYWILK
ncbi:MAG: hypothetical protein OHK0038_00310 [Flammeovirgaceae bacterium]